MSAAAFIAARDFLLHHSYDEFAELPKTISGKIRRAELRRKEAAARAAGRVGAQEFIEA